VRRGRSRWRISRRSFASPTDRPARQATASQRFRLLSRRCGGRKRLSPGARSHGRRDADNGEPLLRRHGAACP
jgi:hypothetical protein